MNTYGYDILIQSNESLLNKALGALFYTGKLQASGTYAFVDNVPERLRGFTQVGYKVRLKNEPCLDLIGPPVETKPIVVGNETECKESDDRIGHIGIRLSLELVLRVLTSVDLEFDVDIGVTVQIGLDKEDSTLKYNLANTEIYDLKINDTCMMHKNMLDKTNEIIAIILKHYLTKDIKNIQLPIDLTRITVDLPQAENALAIKLPIKLADIIILNQKLIVIGLNFITDDHGSLSNMIDLTNNSEIYFSVSTKAIRRVMEFWWDATELKQFPIKGSLPVNVGLNKVLSKGTDIITRLITLGLLEPTTEVESARLFYDASVKLMELPDILFEPGEFIKLQNLNISLNISARLEANQKKRMELDTSLFIPDKLTPWEDDKLLSEKSKTKDLFKLNDTLNVIIENAKCKIAVDNANQIVINICSADFNLDFGSKWYDNLTEKIMNGFIDILEKHIIHRIPAFVISPSLLLKNINIMGYTFAIDIKDIDMESMHISLSTNVSINELEKSIAPVALYIGNTKSQKLHRVDCRVVEDIDYTHQVGYHLVYDAINDGFKPCQECLPGYSKMVLRK